MNAPVNVAILGLGGAGRAHLKYFKDSGQAEVAAVLDPKGEACREALVAAGLPGVPIYQDFHQLLDVPGLDAVSICSPDNSHYEYAMESLEAGKHVLCEKPVVTTARQGQELIEAVARSGRTFASFHQLRFHGTYEAAKQIIASGEIGDIFCVEGDYVHSLQTRAGQFDDWRLSKPFGQPPQLGGGIHFTDLFLWFLEDDVDECHSYANNISFPAYPECDCVMSIMRFKRGCVGRVLTAFGVSMPQNFKIRVYGAKGSIIENMVFIGERFDRFTTLPKAGVKQTVVTEIIRRWPLPTMRDFPFYGYDHRTACMATVRDFLNSVLTGSAPRCDVIGGVKASLASIHQTESYRTGSPVRG